MQSQLTGAIGSLAFPIIEVGMSLSMLINYSI